MCRHILKRQHTGKSQLNRPHEKGMNRKLVVVLILIAAFLVISAIPNIVLAKLFFRPNYTVTFSGDLDGAGPIMVTGNFKVIKTNGAKADFTLEYSTIFGDFAGTHVAYIYMEREKKDPTIEMHITYQAKPGLYHYLNGHGVLEGNVKEGWFTIDTSGYKFTLSKASKETEWEYVEIWDGSPSFTVEGEKL